MVLDDYVILGTTVPEPCHDGRVFVCSAGVSAERRSLVRVYPLAVEGIPHRWHAYRVPVELNPQDSRVESYKVSGDRSGSAHRAINSQLCCIGAVVDHQRSGLVRPYFVDSIAEANDRRMSLAVIRPKGACPPELHFEHNPTSPVSPQLRLWPTPVPSQSFGSGRFPFVPRLSFCDDGGAHDLQLRDWGVYELMRKNIREPDYYRAVLADALHLGTGSCLLVGNMCNQRTAWLVISVLNGLLEPSQLTLTLPENEGDSLGSAA